MKFKISLPLWSIIFPLLAWVIYAGNTIFSGGWYAAAIAIALKGAVLSAVHHAEVVAHKIGEPYGTLVLAICITILEVGLIVSLMLAGGESTAALARDTVFAAVMIILTGIVGLCLLIGGVVHREQMVGPLGANTALVTLTAILVLTLILPNYTTTVTGPTYSVAQLIFVAIVSLILYGTFVLVQTVRHRDYFLPQGFDGDEDEHAAPPSKQTTYSAFALLLLSLGAVILLGKALAPDLEVAVAAAGAPQSLVGVIVAAIILLPEGLAAVRAARKNRLQTSLNLALGSGLASIGLTIPAVAVVSLVTDFTITLGIDMKSTVLLFLAIFTIMLSLAKGKTNVQHGIVLLLLFAVYLFTTIVP